MADYIISSGQFFDSDYCGVNDEIIVQSGGLMNYTSIPQYASSVTLEEGVYLLGVRIPVEINVQGTVAGFERNTLNISKRKPEDGLMLNDWSLLTNVSSLSLYVGSDQADGTYRLLGNAAGFDGTISLVDCFDAAIGELLLENPELDYEFRRYSLLLNEANELCLTVSSSLPESAGILLYKDGQLVDDSLQTVYDFDVPTDDYNHMFVVSGGYAEEINVYSGGLLTVMSGGVVDAVMVHLGMLEVSNGGKVKDLLLGNINVTISVTGGEVDGIRDNMYAGANAKLYVGEYGIVRNAETNGFREVIVDSNGLIENSLVAYGKIIALAGGTVSKIHGIWQGEADISVYGTSYDVILNSPNAVMFLHDGGKAFGTLLNGRDVVMTVSGGSAIETEVRSGFLHVSSGGTLKDTRLNGQYGETLAGGDFEYKILGEILVSEGGLSLGTKITAGSQTVSRGGIAERTEITSIGNMVVSNGGLASETSLSDDGRMVVSKGGLASETNLLNGGRLTVDHGGVARDVHASRYGVIDVGRFGLASSVVLDGYNMMLVSGSGRVEDVEVASGAEVYLYNGAVLGGRMQVAEGAVVYAFEGGTIDFDLSKASDTAPLFSDFSVIAGTPELTITVSADTAEGTYLLAARAAGFTGTITVQDETMLYGDLGMNNPLAYGWNTYTLNLKNDALSLTVTRNAEEAPSEGEEREIVRETVYDTIVHNGEVFSAAGGYAYYAPVVNSGGTLNVRSGAKMEETLVNRGGIINVESGGSADSTNVVWGEMTVLDGGSADGIRVDCATLTVSSGGKASNVVMSDKVDPATLHVTGGEVDGLYMPYGLFNHIYVGESGVIRNADVCGFGISGESTLTVGSGGILEYSTLSASPSTSVKQEAVVLAGGTVNSVVLAGGILTDGFSVLQIGPAPTNVSSTDNPKSIFSKKDHVLVAFFWLF